MNKIGYYFIIKSHKNFYLQPITSLQNKKNRFYSFLFLNECENAFKLGI